MRDLSTLLVIDLEETCFEGIAPPNPDAEIIEIGLAVLDMPSRQIVEQRSIIVKPEHSLVSEFCTSLTSLTQEEVDKGITLAAACKILKKEYLSRDRNWSSYGAYDQRAFRRECGQKGIAYPFGIIHLDIKGFFELKYQEKLSLTDAMYKCGLEFEGRAHRGVVDAYNTARLLLTLL